MTADIASGSKVKPTKDNRKISMDVVDIDFNPESLSANANANANKSRSKRNTRTTAASGSRKTQTQTKGDSRGSKGRSTGSEPAKREDDRSTEGIFGRASLLFPLRMGARSAEQSVWAEGMKLEDGTFILVYSGWCCEWSGVLSNSTKSRVGTINRKTYSLPTRPRLPYQPRP